MSPAKTKTNGTTNRAQRRFKRSTAVLLRFEDPDMEGLEVRTRRVSLGTAFDLEHMATEMDDADGLGSREQMQAFLGAFADKVLLSWNVDADVLDDDGNETGEVRGVPTTVEGLMSLDLEFVMSVFQAWMSNVVGVSGPLGATSPGGGPSEGLSLPMEPLSSSPES